MMFPLEWERLIWSARPGFPSAPAWRRDQYALTDLRLVVRSPAGIVHEIAIDEVEGLGIERTLWQRAMGTSDLVVRSRRARADLFVLPNLTRADLLALILHLFAHDAVPNLRMDAALVDYAVESVPRPGPVAARRLVAMAIVAALVVGGVAVRLHVDATAVAYAADDPLSPAGVKRSRDEIAAFMEHTVMPWAREALAPVVGRPDQVTCLTCHGIDAKARDWKMPGVSELPYPAVRTRGLELYGNPTDPQVRNAIYADLAQDDRQRLAAYMRMVVMPGMAALLKRPAYDFSKSFRENRARAALGCYHCHRVGD